MKKQLQRAYDRAMNLKENYGKPGTWGRVVYAARGFIGSLNPEGHTLSSLNPDLDPDLQEVGDVAMALIASERFAKDITSPHFVVANIMLKAIDGL